ncbi:hypothetical protein [Clostridium perfringens]|uniref:hypothetical protein n=1 Tax=Clostridium perfringens TaxID=1502 RepID=UPI0039E74A75
MSKVKKKTNEELSDDEKIEILDRRINFLIGGLMGQGVAIFTIVGIILNVKDTDIIFFTFIQNQYTLGILVCIEIWILYYVVKNTLKYLKTIEKLKGITGKEDFLK